MSQLRFGAQVLIFGLYALALPLSAQAAGLTGELVHGELETEFAGTFPVTDAVVSEDIEFSRTFTFGFTTEVVTFDLDVADDRFTITYVNNITNCPGGTPTCGFNMGLDGIEISNLPGGVFALEPLSSTFPAGTISGTDVTPTSVRVDFPQPQIPGFGTTWTATWQIIAEPVIELTASPSAVIAGNSTQLSWKTFFATECAASGDWSGQRPLSGDESIPLTSSSAFTLSCNGPEGSSFATVTLPVFAGGIVNGSFEDTPSGSNPTPWFLGAIQQSQQVTTAPEEFDTDFFVNRPPADHPQPTDGDQMMRIGFRDPTFDPTTGRANDADLSQSMIATSTDITFDARLYCTDPADEGCSFSLRILKQGASGFEDLIAPVSGFEVGPEISTNQSTGFSCDTLPCTASLRNGIQNDYMSVRVSDLPLDTVLIPIFSVRDFAWAYLDNVVNADVQPFTPVISYSPNPGLPGGSNPIEGDFVFFDCNSTTGVAPENLQCNWSVTSTALGTQQAQGRVAVFAFPQDEIVDVTLTASDGNDSVETSTSVTIDNGAPLINAVNVEVAENGTAEAICRFADPGALDTHVVTFDLDGATAIDATNLAEENSPSLASGFGAQRFNVAGIPAGTVLEANCNVFDGVDTTDDAFTITVLGNDEIAARESTDTDSSIGAPLVTAGVEVIGKLDSLSDIDVFEITTAEGLKVGGEFVVNLKVPADYDLIIFSRNSSADANSSPFINAPFINAPFINAPFINVPFINVPFINAPFINAPFINAPFINAPFINAPFINAPFINAPLTSSPFINAGFEFQDFPLSQVGLAAPDGSNTSGIDIGLDELGAADLGSLAAEGLEATVFSASAGTQPERVLVKVSPGTQQMFAAVVSNSGSFATAPYSMRVEASVPPSQEQLIGAQCIREPLVASSPSTTTVETLHDNVDPLTLIVTQRERMIETHGMSDQDFTDFMLALQPFLNHPLIQAKVISVPSVIYDVADTNQCLIDEQNKVTDAIRDIINLELASANIENIQIMGGVDIVPPRYSPDETTVGYEGLYTQDLLLEPGRPIAVAFAEGNNITDAVYGDLNPLQYRGRELYLEDVAVARLVETPTEILAAANTFVATGGIIPLTNTIATGYDFFRDGTEATAAILRTIATNTNAELISEDWKGDDLRCGYLDNVDNTVAMCPVQVPPTAPSVAAINFHASYNAGLSAFGFSNFTTGATAAEVIGANEANMLLEGGLTLSIGCHSGLNVPDAWALPDNVGFPLSPSQDWAQQPGNWIGPWNYGLGDNTVADRGTEGLITLVVEELATGANLGQALIRAKQRYAVGLFEFDVHDEKSLIGLALFGMPQAVLDVPANPPAPVPPEIPNSVPAGTLQLEVADSAGGIISSNSFDFLEVTTSNGRYFPLNGKAQAVVGRPLLPTALPIKAQPVPAGAQRIHDVVIRSGSYNDELGVDPVFAFPQHDWVTNTQEPRACVQTFAPSQLGIATSVNVGNPSAPTTLESLIVLGAQFRCTSQQGAPVTGTLRKYSGLNVDAQRPNSAALANDFDPPSVTMQQLLLDPSTGDGTATVNAQDANGLREIIAAIFEDADGVPGGPGIIRSVSTGNITGQTGPFVINLPNVASNPVGFQYIDNAGNVLLKTGKGQLLQVLQPVTDLAARGRLTEVTLTWTHPSAASYNVYRTAAGGPEAIIGSTTSTYSLFTDTGLTLGVNYCYQVTAVGAAGGESVRSNQVCITPAPRRRGR